jgi:NAD(P)-dependent dehydrogenase (short-subunit alcohol dehydrogenase family)
MYLVTGATGHVGGPVARQLHEQGHSVRALMRGRSGAASLPAGIELAVGDLDDPDSVSKAVQGVEAIFLMHVGTGTEQTKAMIAAAQDAAMPRIVLLSSAALTARAAARSGRSSAILLVIASMRSRSRPSMAEHLVLGAEVMRRRGVRHPKGVDHGPSRAAPAVPAATLSARSRSASRGTAR